MDMEPLGLLSGTTARKMLEDEGITAPSVRILGHFFRAEDHGSMKIWMQKPNFDVLIAQAKSLLKDGGFFEHQPARLICQQQSA